MDTRLALHLLAVLALAGCAGSPASQTPGSLATGTATANEAGAATAAGPHVEKKSWHGEYTGGAAQVPDSEGGTLCNAGLSSVTPTDASFRVKANATLFDAGVHWDNTVPQSLYLDVYDPGRNETKVKPSAPNAPGQLNVTVPHPAVGTWAVFVCVEGATAGASFDAVAKAFYP